MISNSGHDERNQYHGGEAGDQTTKEWEIREWYNRPWTCVLRHPDPIVREVLALYAERAANNNNIGYDMWQRLTYWQMLEKYNYDPATIAEKCEADCSSGVTANVKAAGMLLGDESLANIDVNTYTETMRKNFQKAGFKVLTAKKYLNSQDELLRGDILLNDLKHVATNLTNGKKIQNAPTVTIEEVTAAAMKAREKYSKPQQEVPKYTEYEVYKLNTYLNVRKAPFNGSIVGKLYNGNRVKVVSVTNGWAKLDNGNYISANYIKKV